MKERSHALPSSWYGDPADNVEQLSKVRKEQEKQDERDRLRKGRKVRAAVKDVLLNGGHHRR